MENRGWLSVLRLVAITAFVGLSTLYGGYNDKWSSYDYHYSYGGFGYAKYMQTAMYDDKGYWNYGGDQDSVAYDKGWYPQYRAYTYQREGYIKEARYGLQSL